MQNIVLKVEFLGGTSIRHAVEEAKELAQKLEIGCVKFQFNGKSLCVGILTDIDEAIVEYHANKTQQNYN